MRNFLLFIFLIGSSTFLAVTSPVDWGLFGHRKINRMAIFTLPPELIGFYKSHIEYITTESVSPDKRRYSVKEEATRHYIDIDHWGEFPFPDVPRDYHETIFTYADIYYVTEKSDTVFIKDFEYRNGVVNKYNSRCTLDTIRTDSLRAWFHRVINYGYEEREWITQDVSILDSLECTLPSMSEGISLEIKDNFTAYGILPFHIEVMQKRLTQAFYNRNINAILWLSSEIGHYISDGHVPLHTTENYNGQMTNQLGLHAFWESRLPELFADQEYDFFVGKPEYIDNLNEWVWDIVLSSHSDLDDVLDLDKKLAQEFPPDKQMCFEDRFDRTVKTQCKEYSEAYHRALDGMVERKMRSAIQAVASSWYSAWVDAGQPDMSKLMGDYVETEEERMKREELEKKFNQGEILGRKHGN